MAQPEVRGPAADGAGSVALLRVCVFCGSRAGQNPAYLEAARELGREMGRRGLELVYGGGNMGLMGAVASQVAAAGGRVQGVIPSALQTREVAGESIGEVVVVRNMHERKAAMAREADAFCALPGGFGTFEELLEMLTWLQLGIHSKAVGVLNVEGYYDHLLKFFDVATDQGFVARDSRESLICATTVPELLDKLAAYRAKHVTPVSTQSWELGYRLKGY